MATYSITLILKGETEIMDEAEFKYYLDEMGMQYSYASVLDEDDRCYFNFHTEAETNVDARGIGKEVKFVLEANIFACIEDNKKFRVYTKKLN